MYIYVCLYKPTTLFLFLLEAAKRSTAKALNTDSSAALPCVVAAALAEAFSCVVRVPFEQLKMRMQVSQ